MNREVEEDRSSFSATPHTSHATEMVFSSTNLDELPGWHQKGNEDGWGYLHFLDNTRLQA